jgi:hypothetical protein
MLQALRATLLLVPLLGLHYLVTPFRPSENHPWEGVYEVTSAITASFQVSFNHASAFFTLKMSQISVPNQFLIIVHKGPMMCSNIWWTELFLRILSLFHGVHAVVSYSSASRTVYTTISTNKMDAKTGL